MDARTCPACGGPLAPWQEVPGGEPADPRRYALARCAACGSAVTTGESPGPAAYEAGVYAPGPPRARRIVASAQRALTAQPVRLLRRAGVPPGGRVLDAGAGTGRLVAALARDGYAATGIEPSERSRGRAQGQGLPVAHAHVGEHEASGLDAVVLWHVLEHLEEPGAALVRVREWLAPGGVALIAVPNLASWQARVAGPAWLHLDAPRHRTHFTPPGLRTLAERSGLRPETTRHMVWEHNPAGMWMALLARAGGTPGFPFHALKRNVPVTPRDVAVTALGVPLAPVALGLEVVAAGLRRGGTIALVARRA